MTKRERRALGRYVRWIADAMELRDWTIHLADAPCDPEYSAKVELTEGRKHATISFNPRFREGAAEDQRQTIVHELVHCHFALPWRMVQTDLLQPLGQETYSIFCDSFRRTLEYGVDAVADAIAKHMPLIEWPLRP